MYSTNMTTKIDYPNILAHNVPRFIEFMRSRGGVTQKEWDWLRNESENPDYPAEVVMKADEYILFPKDEETFNHGLFVLVKALAILSFVPGGVRFWGLRFDSEVSGFVEDD